MADFITLTCPSCGAALNVSTSASTLKCIYCGNEHLVRKHGGEISLEQSNVWSCPQCGTLTPPGTSFCPKCGFAIARNCPNCKHRIYSNAVFCPECGVNIKDIDQQILMKQAAKKQRCDQINAEIKLLNDEITQAGNKLPKMSGGWSILFLGLGGLAMGVYAFSLMAESNSSNTSFAIPFCVFSIVLLVLALIVIVNRNQTYEKQKKIELVYNNKCHKINELKNEYTTLMSREPE
jgi:predicted RNA-binding Zn-ribbon protein involved in translation (DUF1610 family)